MRPSIVNDLIAIIQPSVAVAAGAATAHEIVFPTDYAIEIRALSIYCEQTAPASSLNVYLRRSGGGDVHLWGSPTTLALPRDEPVILYNPILMGRGDRLLVLHGSVVTIAGTMYARTNGLIVTD